MACSSASRMSPACKGNLRLLNDFAWWMPHEGPNLDAAAMVTLKRKILTSKRARRIDRIATVDSGDFVSPSWGGVRKGLGAFSVAFRWCRPNTTILRKPLLVPALSAWTRLSILATRVIPSPSLRTYPNTPCFYTSASIWAQGVHGRYTTRFRVSSREQGESIHNHAHYKYDNHDLSPQDVSLA